MHSAHRVEPSRPGPIDVPRAAADSPSIEVSSEATGRKRSVARVRLEAALLECFQVGIVLLDGSLRLLTMNGQARTLVESSGGMFVDRNRHLRSPDTGSDELLQRSLNRASSIRLRLPGTCTGLLRLDPGGKNEIEVAIVALPATESSPAVVAVFLSRPSDGTPDAAFLSRRFALTKAESRLAVELAKGRSLSEVAGKLGLSLGTVRTQLKGIFVKTGTCRQAELVGVLTKGLAHVRLQHYLI